MKSICTFLSCEGQNTCMDLKQLCSYSQEKYSSMCIPILSIATATRWYNTDVVCNTHGSVQMDNMNVAPGHSRGHVNDLNTVHGNM